MTKFFQIVLICLLTTSYAFSQISFSDQSFSLLPNPTAYSGVSMGISDMNGDGLDDIIRFNAGQTLSIEYQEPNGAPFTNLNLGPIVGSPWSMCIADVDGNGFNDIMAGGFNDNLKLLTADASGNNYIQSIIPNSNIFLQGSNFVDIDNNGTVDIFACHDNGLSPSFSNDGSGNFTFDPTLLDASSTVPSDNSGNYGSIWTDYDGDGDIDMYLSKCRLGVTDPADGRRRNMLFQNDGNNNYTDVAAAAGLLPLAQSWASDFADIDNDGDLDCFIANHDIVSQMLINNGDGTFTDITSTTGISADLAAIPSGIQCIFDDFDNDGFVDLLYTSLNNAHALFRNNGDLTFSALSFPFPTPNGIQSAVTGDLNNDGYLDVFAGFAAGYNNPVSSRPDKIYINQSSGNNFVKITLEGTGANRNAIGARLEIHGSWGIQVREIRSGESYGIMNSMVSHFGLGAADKIDKLVVRWPNGVTKVLCGLESNKSHVIKMEDMYDNCMYVNATATGGTEDGSSWENAFSDLQDALAVGTNTAILVAKGTYYPTAPGNSRAIFFKVPSGATVLGGYEPMNSSRDSDLHPTILSGDIDLGADLDGNSFHVVQFKDSDNAILDGLTIQDGNANNASSFARSRGGGIYSTNSTFTLRNCLVQNNNAVFGGGMFATLSNEVNIEGSTFSENTAERGAGLYHSNETNLYVRHSRIINNSSAVRCVIESNNSLYTYIENSVIANNASAFANAIGIIATNRDQSCDIYNSTILGESLNRSLFSLQVGFGDQLDINIYNSIIGHQNPAFNKSFAIFNNNILNLNTENCYIQGSSVVGTATNNLYSENAGDLFLNPDYSVESCSPVVDQGNNTYAALLGRDIDGNDRIFGLSVDIGAYEAQTICVPAREVAISDHHHKIFPNPVSDVLTIQLDEVTNQDMNIQVFDIKGQMMKTIFIPAGNFSTDVNVKDLSEGVYILHFIGEDITSRKFIVRK